jgi:RNA polymerase sigma factor (sigma-70 family)
MKEKRDADYTLWKEFKEGSENAFSFIFREHYAFLIRYGLKICRDEDFVKDSIQNLFITLWKNKNNLGDTDNIKLYLLTAVRRKLIKDIQVSNKREALSKEIEPEPVFSYEDTIIKQEITEQKRKQLLNALNSLPPKSKEVIYLKFFKKLSYEEIAEVMSIKYQSVRNHVHEALKMLREKLQLILLIILFY